MDSLDNIHRRLKELIEAKIERRDALLAEVATIERELDEAKAWFHAAWKNPAVMAEPPPPAERRWKKRGPAQMPRDKVIALIRERGGACHAQEILDHFGMKDGRAAVTFRRWAKLGWLESCGDGIYKIPA